MNMKRFAFALAGLSLAAGLWAQTPAAPAPAPAPPAAEQPAAPSAPAAPAPALLFVESEPMGALVVIGRDLQEKVTPFLLRQLPPKEYKLRLFKTGYEAREVTLTLAPGEVKVLKVNLSRSYSAVAFPEAASLNLAGKDTPSSNIKFKLPAGNYNVFQDDGILTVKPVFPNEHLLTLTSFGIPVTVLLAGALTLQDVNNPRGGSVSLSPITLASYSLFLADILWFSGLSSQKANFLRDMTVQASPQTLGLGFPQDLYAKADKALDNGDVAAAEKYYFMVASEFPESSWAPEALFKMARLHGVQGKQALAKAEFLLLTEVYPLSSLYDRAHKALADQAYANGDLTEALFHLDQLTYTDPLITREDIAAFRTQIGDDLKGSTK